MTFYISRFRDMESKEFDVEVVTPMFLGGANNLEAELRLPSIKGMLRFWWRAICGIDRLEEMKEKEAEIFGSTQSKATFSMKLQELNNVEPIKSNLPSGKKFRVESKSKGKTFNIGIIDYLVFGIRDHRKGYVRKHFPSGTPFKIKFTFYNNAYQESVLSAFRAFIFHGGLGAKSRNGFGSLCITNEEKRINVKTANKMKEYSAISNKTVLFDGLNEHDKWEDALSEIGMAYKDARLSIEKKHVYDQRLLIAKPIVQTGNSKERHAKPYLLHVNKLKNGSYIGQIMFMPYYYYQAHKRDEYMQVCREVNAELSKLLKVQK